MSVVTSIVSVVGESPGVSGVTVYVTLILSMKKLTLVPAVFLHVSISLSFDINGRQLNVEMTFSVENK